MTLTYPMLHAQEGTCLVDPCPFCNTEDDNRPTAKSQQRIAAEEALARHPLGTAEEERALALNWAESAALFHLNEQYWRGRVRRAEQAAKVLLKGIPGSKCGDRGALDGTVMRALLWLGVEFDDQGWAPHQSEGWMRKSAQELSAEIAEFREE